MRGRFRTTVATNPATSSNQYNGGFPLMARLTHGLGLTAALLITAGTAHAANYNQLLASPNSLPPNPADSGAGPP